MSTIKSSDEHLTLNADGTSKDIKFQANGVEKASISSAGVISSDGGSTHADNVKAKFGTSNDLEIYHDGSNSRIKDVGTGVLAISGNELNFNNADNTTNLLIIKDDGRGLSQFTAKAWLTYNHENTPSILDSHNISSVTDRGTGLGTMNFANAMGNTNYCVVGSALDGGGENDNRHFNHSAGSTETTSAFDFFTGYVDISGVYEGRTVANDCSRVSVHVFGD